MSLNPQQRDILEHVFRYRLTTPQVLADCPRISLSTLPIAKDALQELEQGGWLQMGRLTPHAESSPFFYLTPRAATELGQDEIMAKEPSREMRIEAFAIARFCCCGDSFRELFTKQEFVERFASIWYPGQPVRYYLEPTPSGDVRLAFLKVDKGGPSRWDRIIESCQRFMAKRTTSSQTNPQFQPHVEEFRNLVESGRFQISLLTSLPEKRDAILQALDVLETSHGVRPPIVPYVIDGLFDVIHPRRDETPGA